MKPMKSLLYESILETREILKDKDLMKNLKKGIEEIKQGKGIPWEEAQRQLDLS